jgi:ABC-type nitrate/sulfonate/bicarbonate transport system permease component
MKRSESIGKKLISPIFLLLLTVIWQLVSEGNDFFGRILPPPLEIVKTFINQFTVMLPHALITLNEAAIGFIASILLGLLLAVLMDAFEPVHSALYPLILVSQTIPLIALAPLFLLWFGFGQLPKILIVVLVCFFPVLVSLLDGLKSVDPDMLNLLKSMGAGRILIFRLVKLPGAMMSFFSGLRIAATYSIMGAVIAEWVGGIEGLGVYMIRVKNSFAYDRMFAAILLIVVLSMALFGLISIIQDILMPWSKLQRKENWRN